MSLQRHCCRRICCQQQCF